VAKRRCRFANIAREVRVRIHHRVPRSRAHEREVFVPVAVYMIYDRKVVGLDIAAVKDRYLVTPASSFRHQRTTHELRSTDHKQAHFRESDPDALPATTMDVDTRLVLPHPPGDSEVGERIPTR
jgi:hypothetical protein